MTRHIDPDFMEDYLEGLLPSDAESEIRQHLAECPRCREELASLGRLLESLGKLPTEAVPARDLWPQVAWRLESASREAAPATSSGTEPAPPMEAPVPSRSTSTPDRASRGRRWVSVPAWQLLAASIALMVISGGSVWAFLTLGPQGRAPTVTRLPAAGSLVGWEEAYRGYDEAVADLEDVLEQGREVLDPETVRVLEQNLQSIDEAIQEAEEALARDPSSGILRRFLAENLRRKVDLLRHAADAVYSIT